MVKFSFPQGSQEEDEDLFLSQTAFFAKEEEEVPSSTCDSETQGRSVDDSDSNNSSTTNSDSESKTQEMDGENAAGDFARAVVETPDPYDTGDVKIQNAMAVTTQWFANGIGPIGPSNYPQLEIKVGLSRRTKVVKPLHPNAKKNIEEAPVNKKRRYLNED